MIALSPEQAAWLKTLVTQLYLPHDYYLTPVRMGLTPDGKKDPRPLCPYTGWRSVTQTLETVDVWFSDLPIPFNGFLARAADMLVLDTDSPETTRAIAELIERGKLPATRWVVATGRGYHFYYVNVDALPSRSGPGIDIQTTVSRFDDETNGKGVMVAGSWHPVRKCVYELVDFGAQVEPTEFRHEHMAALEQEGAIEPEKPPRQNVWTSNHDEDPERFRGMLLLLPPQDEPTFFKVATSLLTVFRPEEVVGWAALGAKYRPVQDRQKIEGWAKKMNRGRITIGTAIHYYQSSGAYSQRLADAAYHMARISS